MVDQVLSEAVIAYVGVAGRLDSRSPEDRVVALVGDQAAGLLPKVTEIVAAVYAADPPLHDFDDLSEMAAAVRGWLTTRHPELSAAAVEAVVNTFTFAWK